MKQRFCLLLAAVICLSLNIASFGNKGKFFANEAFSDSNSSENHISTEGKIKYIDFTPTASALRAAADIDIKSHGSDEHIDWITLLSVWAAKKGGSFKDFSSSKLADIAEKIKKDGAYTVSGNRKLFDYYYEAYSAVLGGMLGDYAACTKKEGEKKGKIEEKYGIRSFSPIASGYYYNDYDDFGASRSFGYRRRHLGHDMMGSVGTPIIAIESGYVECLGWNVYGGWRIGIRSFDGKRYYYYAHLRRGHPYNDIYEGKTVDAGDVIGYLGMTGYSTQEDKNNIDTPHLHIGLQIIFTPEQKDGYNQIWVDMYALTSFLSSWRAPTYFDSKTNERYSIIHNIYPETPD